jgi:TetR/AcrR family transcriptional repressor of nem operon
VNQITTREKLLNAGLRVLFRRGYIGSGVRDIVAEANIPLGSFTNYFRTKEGFVFEVLNRYFDNIRLLMGETLTDKTLSARERMKKYLDIISGRLEDDKFERGCLIGDLSLEASTHSEVLRERLAAIFSEWLIPFKECIAQGQRQGEIPSEFTPDELAEFLLASWQGAILRMKVERNAAPLDRFKVIALNTVFRSEGEKFLQALTGKNAS